MKKYCQVTPFWGGGGTINCVGYTYPEELVIYGMVVWYGGLVRE